RACDLGMPVGGEPDAHRDRGLECVPNARRHSPSYEVAALPHRAWLDPAPGPAERLGAPAIAFAQCLAAVGSIAMLVAIRIAPHAKPDRIELERDREPAHRALECIAASCCARRAHVARRREIEPRELVRVLRIGASVEQPGPAGLLPMEVLVLRGHRD